MSIKYLPIQDRLGMVCDALKFCAASIDESENTKGAPETIEIIAEFIGEIRAEVDFKRSTGVKTEPMRHPACVGSY